MSKAYALWITSALFALHYLTGGIDFAQHVRTTRALWLSLILSTLMERKDSIDEYLCTN
jgi:multidrug transporter EmrE-like cation transporter